ncbi:MAG TPA: LuxR C-terminal-related transcriptional regulator [Anaerolinea sp.]|nr:LuxR C-terminal-related transcriptional regulator [Anaerolinea sp.]
MQPSPPLSDREWEVVNLLRQGKTNRQIAAALHITERTVEFHLNNIYAKFQVRSRVELVLKLGESTVAPQGQIAENGDSPRPTHWASSLRDAVSNIGKELNMADVLHSDARVEANPTTFFGAVRACLVRFAEFNGRAARPEFWWFALFVTLLTSALAYLSQNVAAVVLVVLLLPFLAAGARRLRDAGRSVWYLWFLLVPVGGIVALGFLWALPSISPLPEDTQAA